MATEKYATGRFWDKTIKPDDFGTLLFILMLWKFTQRRRDAKNTQR